MSIQMQQNFITLENFKYQIVNFSRFLGMRKKVFVIFWICDYKIVGDLKRFHQNLNAVFFVFYLDRVLILV